jgi:hypothetical protein
MYVGSRRHLFSLKKTGLGRISKTGVPFFSLNRTVVPGKNCSLKNCGKVWKKTKMAASSSKRDEIKMAVTHQPVHG